MLETNGKIESTLVTLALRKNIIFKILRHKNRFLRSYHIYACKHIIYSTAVKQHVQCMRLTFVGCQSFSNFLACFISATYGYISIQLTHCNFWTMKICYTVGRFLNA